MSGLTRWLRGALMTGALLTSGFGVDAAHADPPARPSVQRDQPGPNKVRVGVKVVRATPNGNMDPRLQDIAKQLRANFSQFQGFQLQSTHQDVIGPNQSANFVFEGRRAVVTLVNREETRARVRIELFKGSDRTMDTTVWIPRGKSMIVSINGSEGRFVLPVSVGF